MSENTTETDTILSQNNNEDMYNYLVETLEGTGAKIEVLDNGGIWVSNWKAEGAFENQLYIPPNLDSNKVSMISYLPGSGGFAYDAQPLRNKILSEAPPDCIITLAQGCTDRGNTMEAAATICEDNGLQITNLTVQTFSASGGVGFQQLEKFLVENPNVNATMIVADGYNMERSSVYFNDIDTLAERGVPIVLVNPHNTRLNGSVKFLTESGLNVYVMESDRGGHTDINKDIINNGLLEYSLGIADEFGGPNNNLDKCNYILLKYDPENPDSNQHGFVLLDGYEYIRQENEAYGYTLERLNSNPFDDGTVGSDMYGVVNSLNSIRQSMGMTEMVTPTHTSTSTIPGNLMNAETSLMGISSDLNGTIYKDTQVIASIAQVFYDMDRERTNAAAALSDGRELLFDEAAYTDTLNQLINYDITSEIKFESFMFNPFSHTEGNSGKICLSDLNSMLSGGSLAGPLHENLENERQSAKATRQELDNLNTMISSGTNFQGDIWKAVSKRLTDYSDLMDLRIESADKLEEAMAEAIKLIVDYMGEYEELDDSKLPELKEKAEQVKQAIIDAQKIVDATHNVSVPVEDGNGATTYRYVTQYVYSSAARAEARNYIYKSRVLLLEITREINKLENLPIILAKAEQIINDALSEIYANYGVKASNAVTGRTVSYEPPQNTNYIAPALKTTSLWFNSRPQIEGKVDEGTYNMRPELKKLYASYEDYVNDVLKENNPMYNHEMEDNGIEPGESLDDKIFEKDEEEPEQEDVTENPKPEEESGTPDNPTPNPETPSNPDPKPENPSDPEPKPENPSEPEPENPSNPEPKPETPSEPEPENPSNPEPKPETPSEPEPENPSDPEPKPDTPSDPKPETPSDPSPETPRDPEPENPSEPKPEAPSNPKPVTPGQPKPETPSEPNPVVPGEPSTDDGTVPPIIEIPDDGEPDTPIIDQPIVDEPIIEDKPIIDITPPGNDDNNSSSGSDGINLTKAIGVSLGVGAAVGAAALGAHTVKKAKDNNIYEDE